MSVQSKRAGCEPVGVRGVVFVTVWKDHGTQTVKAYALGLLGIVCILTFCTAIRVQIMGFLSGGLLQLVVKVCPGVSNYVPLSFLDYNIDSEPT
jgi:hypothetical protein